ncbi:MAG TPA: hypothetical protein VGP25_20575 [Gemmatimonadaceae bacterium]|jgi:hypothetical protein|nr:hypothetical protein [Gemmatimonadaceae bacterium]
MRVGSRSRRVIPALALLAASCVAPPKRTPDSTDSTGAYVAAPVDDRTRLARLEQEARALAKTNGCNSADSCRTAPVGWRGCGGPRTYIVYCAATTDSAALYRKLDELKEAEMAYNAKSGMMSTCEMRMPPVVTVSGGRCTQ